MGEVGFSLTNLAQVSEIKHIHPILPNLQALMLA